jgi:hypothetical protein
MRVTCCCDPDMHPVHGSNALRTRTGAGETVKKIGVVKEFDHPGGRFLSQLRVMHRKAL